MMSKRHCLAVLSVLLSGALMSSLGGQAKAGGTCWDECYGGQKPPVVYKTYKKRIQVEQGVYEVVRKPSLYGWTLPYSGDIKGSGYGAAYGERSRRVLLKPYRNIAIYNRARHVYTTERVAIQPESYGEWTWWKRLWVDLDR
jgi:hypothetical protein